VGKPLFFIVIKAVLIIVRSRSHLAPSPLLVDGIVNSNSGRISHGFRKREEFGVLSRAWRIT